MAVERVAAISKKDAMRAKPNSEVSLQAVPTGGNKNIITLTKPGMRENTADMSASIARVTGPAQIILGLAAAPFTAGLSSILIGSGVVDLAGGDYARKEQQAQENKRILNEATVNGHTIVVKGSDSPEVQQQMEANSSSGPASREIPLKPGYVEIIRHNPETKETTVKVLFEAHEHEAQAMGTKG